MAKYLKNTIAAQCIIFRVQYLQSILSGKYNICRDTWNDWDDWDDLDNWDDWDARNVWYDWGYWDD